MPSGHAVEWSKGWPLTQDGLKGYLLFGTLNLNCETLREVAGLKPGNGGALEERSRNFYSPNPRRCPYSCIPLILDFSSILDCMN